MVGNKAAAPPVRDTENALSPVPGRARKQAPVSRRKGDLPEGLEAKYLVEHDRRGRAERFHRDNRSGEALFRDHGRRLTAREPYPDVVRDMLRIADHRGWREIVVSGDQAFRREVWVQAQALDLQVRGYRPREIDRQAAERKTPPRKTARKDEDRIRAETQAPTRMAQVAIAVSALIKDPAARDRLMRRAVARVIRHLDAGRRFEREAGQTRIRDRDR
nr:LPD7 domain-containing protein [Brevundimonas naejangsanensis]